MLEASSHFGGVVLVALVRQLIESAHRQFSDRPIFMLEASGHFGHRKLVALLRELRESTRCQSSGKPFSVIACRSPFSAS